MMLLLIISLLFGNPVRVTDLTALKQCNVLGIGTYVVLDNGAEYIISNSGATVNEPTIVQVGSGSKRATMTKAASINSFGISAGGGKSQVQRKANWQLTKKYLTWCMANNVETSLVGDTIEVEPVTSDEIDITAPLTVKGLGRGKTVLSIYPKEKRINGLVNLFDYHGDYDVKMSDLSVYGRRSRWKHETYRVIFRPSGATNTIQIHGSETVRSGFFTDIQVGDTLLLQYDSIQLGFTRTIASINSGASQITFNGAAFAPANDYSTATSYIGREFESTSTNADITTHGVEWRTDEQSNSVFLTNSTIGDIKGNVVFENVDWFGIDYILRTTTTFFADITFNNCSLQADLIAIAWTGVDESKPARLYVNNGEITDCGTIVGASAANTAAYPNTRVGSGVYNHPGVQPYIEGVRIHGNHTNAFRNFSDSGNLRYNTGWSASFKRCVWFDNGEQSILTSECFPTYLEDCFFRKGSGNGIIYVGSDLYATKCDFGVSISLNAGVEPVDYDTMKYRLDFQNCLFQEESQLLLYPGWTGEVMNRTEIDFDNCDFFMGYGSRMWLTTGVVNIRECNMLNKRYRSESSIPQFFNIPNQDTATTWRKGLTVNIDNLQYDTIIPGNLSAWSLVFPPYININISNSIIKNSEVAPLNNSGIITLTNSKIRSTAKENIINVKSFLSAQRRVDVTATKTYSTYPFKNNRVLNKILIATQDADTYVIVDPEIRNIQIDSETGVSLNPMFYGKLNLYAKEAFHIITSGLDTLSNIEGTDTVFVEQGETISLQCSGRSSIISASTALDSITVATTNGTAKQWVNVNTSNWSSTPYVAGTVQVKMGSTVVAEDDFMGRLVGDDDFYGIVNYQNTSYSLYFETPPTTGQALKIVYEKHISPRHSGVFSIIR